MYGKFRNYPIFKDFPPICLYFLDFGEGRDALLSQARNLYVHVYKSTMRK